MYLCQNFIPTNGVSLLSNKLKNRSTESIKYQHTLEKIDYRLGINYRLRRSVLKLILEQWTAGRNKVFTQKTSVVYIPISLAYQDL